MKELVREPCLPGKWIMKNIDAPIIEIFSTFQGEGSFIGQRQIFVRFAGCNLNCSYCDTNNSKSIKSGKMMSVDDVLAEIDKIKTPDCDTLSFTGGEPSLYPEFINQLASKTNLKILLESNGTLPDNIDSMERLDIVSMDIKLPEHLDGQYSERFLDNEIQSLNLLIEKSIPVYCKIVVLPTTETNTIKKVIEKLKDKTVGDFKIIIQPSSPIEKWKNLNSKLFKFSEIIGKDFDVYVIPQMHKILNIR